MNSLYTRILYWLTTIAMYLILGAFVFVCGVIVFRIVTNGYVIQEVPVVIKPANDLPKIESNSSLFSLNSVSEAEAVLNLKMRMTALNAIILFSSFLGYAFFAFNLLRILRQLFSSLLKQNPFDMVNIRRLRQVAGCLVGLVIVDIVTGAYNYYVLSSYFNQDSYVAKIEPGWIPLVLAMTIYVLSTIFRHGYELKTENESIV